MSSGLRGDAEQGATFVELFFDLVFVFAVTQVTGVLAHDLTGAGVVRALIVFWLVWWAWTQFTWSLNEADTEHRVIRLITLGAAALAFLMALTVPDVGDDARLFALSYLLVRIVGIGLQWLLAGGDDAWARAVRRWTIMSSLGLVAVALAAVLPVRYRFAALGVAAILDIVAAWRAGSGEWRLFSAHFAERHGLFVIIALGESLIAAGVTAAEQPDSVALLLATVAALVVACSMWWTYFGWIHGLLEQRMDAQDDRSVGRFARDVFSLAHFPVIAGVIALAVAIEEAVAHPSSPLEPAGVVALTAGIALFVGGAAVAVLLAGHRVPTVRWVVLLVVVGMVPLHLVMSAWAALALMGALVATLGVVEGGGPPAPSTDGRAKNPLDERHGQDG